MDGARRVLVWVGVLLVLAVLSAPVTLGFSVFALGDVLAVGTGLAARLGCSGHFITGLDERQIRRDLMTYSPVNRWLELQFGERDLRASLFGTASARAVYRPGLGCTLDVGDTAALDQLSVATIEPADAPWPAGGTVASIDPAVQALVEARLAADGRDDLMTRALLVVQDGRIVAEAYADGITPRTPLLGMSMGKSVLAILHGRMRALDLLPDEALAEPAAADAGPLFPEWAGDERAHIRLRHLLQMSSGLAFDEAYAPGSDATRMLFVEPDAAAVAIGQPAIHPPGEHFAYSSGTTNLLMRWLRDRLGGSQQQVDFFDRELRAPLGMADAVFETDATGTFVASSFLYASARDWARLGLLMLDEGTINGRQLLDPEWVRRATAANTSSNEPAYGYQFWLNAGNASPRWDGIPDDAYAMMGNRGQVVMVIPSRRAVLVRLGWNRWSYPLEEAFPPLLAALE